MSDPELELIEDKLERSYAKLKPVKEHNHEKGRQSQPYSQSQHGQKDRYSGISGSKEVGRNQLK